MTILPQGNIVLLHNVPLDPTYAHTIYFENATAQYNYFYGLKKYEFTDQYYTRVGKDIQVEVLADEIYDCNYIMFKNLTNLVVGSKWYYGFITNIEYVNNKVSKISYQIDDMQTWFFNYTLRENFVEREHSSSDNRYEHLVDEDIGYGDDYFTVTEQVVDLNNMKVVALIDPNSWGNPQGNAVSINVTDNLVNAVDKWQAIINDQQQLNDLENDLNSVVDAQGILAIYQAPVMLSNHYVVSSSQNLSFKNNNFDVHPYVPKNNKLYNYPYNLIQVSNNNGTVANYKFEWSDYAGNDIAFNYRGVDFPYPQTVLYPIQYRGRSNDYDSGIYLSQFPVCAWLTDSFKAWWAQNKTSFLQNFGENFIKTAGESAKGFSDAVLGYYSGNYNQAIGGLQRSGEQLNEISHLVLRNIAKIADIQSRPSQMSGQLKTDSLNAKLGTVQYNIKHLHIKKEFAIIIDNYFTKYGYACKRLKIPNRKSRAHWCYVKTIGCEIEGSIPAISAKNICNIYDAGITFWQHGNEVGNYSLDNAPTGVEGA